MSYVDAPGVLESRYVPCQGLTHKFPLPSVLRMDSVYSTILTRIKSLLNSHLMFITCYSYPLDLSSRFTLRK